MVSAIAEEIQEKSQGEIRDYFSLLKPRVMSLVIFTSIIGLMLAPGASDASILTMLIAIICISIGAGASGAINMWIERDTDKLMKRTKHRPLPDGRISPDDALAMGCILAVGSVVIMVLAVNLIAAAWLAASILFYVFIYTIWLKPRTPQNIVIGGAAGAFPPIIGWMAVSPTFHYHPYILFAIIFLWTPPHFWALALYRNEDYKNAGIPMMPVVKGAKRTTIEMLIYSIILLAITITPFILNYQNYLYLGMSIMLGANFMRHAIKVIGNPVEENAKPMFKFSILYLFLLFLSMPIDILVL